MGLPLRVFLLRLRRDVLYGLPPDVRRGYAPPVELENFTGLCPSFGLCPTSVGRPEAEPWAQPDYPSP